MSKAALMTLGRVLIFVLFFLGFTVGSRFRRFMKSLMVAVLVASSLWLAQNAAALEIALIDAANAGGSLH